MKVTRGAIPLYYQIFQILRSQIYAREYKPGDLLPTEDELIRRLGVSRTTVRQALHLLLNEGLIYRIAGKGTFVAPKSRTRPADWSVESIDGLIRAGHETKVRFCGTERVATGEGLAKVFDILPGTEVTQIRKLEFVEDQPFIHITIHLPCELAEKIPLELIEERPVFSLIEEYCDRRIREAHQWVSASLIGRDIAHDLKLTPGDPILLVERHFVDETKRVLQVSTDRYRTDHVRHYLRLTRTDAVHGLLVARSSLTRGEQSPIRPGVAEIANATDAVRARSS